MWSIGPGTGMPCRGGRDEALTDAAAEGAVAVWCWSGVGGDQPAVKVAAEGGVGFGDAAGAAAAAGPGR
ncbi:hypothetical protein D1871_11000 [Nakamurella silvestris]|nr:hypothetical protein D1871_11000 [Nakamurella silvestris]